MIHSLLSASHRYDVQVQTHHTHTHTHTHTLTHNGRAKICRDEEQLELKHDSLSPFLSEMKLECLSILRISTLQSQLWLLCSHLLRFRLPLPACTRFTEWSCCSSDAFCGVNRNDAYNVNGGPDWDASDVFQTASTWAKHQPFFNLLPGGFDERFWK